MTRYAFSIWQLQVSWCGVFSLTIGWACTLLVQLLLSLANNSHSRVEVPQNSRPYFIVSFQTPPTWRAKSSYSYPRGTRCPGYAPGTGFPFFGSYDSQGCGGSILIRLHTGCSFLEFKFKLKLHCYWRSVGQFALVSGPLWGSWPDFNYLCLTITFFLLHVVRPLWRKDWSVICNALTG
jgi:hypothetical protein